ncbi:MAG: 30S ribosomal protein S16 [Patescibacteria group bacterium]|nr:30S ribosomal protein S16 [Patescibacteria group bacterium]MCL5257955.1 30S ribosomal protein S16 [Patescibacteria group bacterium]
MLTLKFRLIGKRHQKTYQLVLQEKRSKLAGRTINHQLGWWDPRLKKGAFKSDQIRFYLDHGAEASDSVWNLLIKNKIIIGKKRPVAIKLKEKNEAEVQTTV